MATNYCSLCCEHYVTALCQDQPTSEGPAALIEPVASALSELCSNRPLVIAAIDGRGGAGKTTLAGMLHARLGAAVVAIDDFYRVMDDTDRFELGPEAGHMQYFDWQRLQSQLLEPLRRGDVARYERFDWRTRRLGSTAEVSPAGIVIVEGVGSFRPEFRSFYDYSVYVEAPRDLCDARLRARGDSEAWIERWNAAHDWYEQHHDPIAAVNVVIK
jgi:uridine kinase